MNCTTFKDSAIFLKKKCCNFVVALAICFGSSTVAYSQDFVEFEQDANYYYGTLTTKKTVYYKYKVPANSFGVFTLKNNSGRSDFDINVYEYVGDFQLLDKGTSSGTQTELIVISPSSENRYVYIQVMNYGSTTSEYRLYSDYVSPINKFGISATKTILTCGLEENDISNEATSRAVSSIFSLLESNSLVEFGKDFVVNEVTTQMRNQFGYGCMGDFMVDWIASMVLGFYKNYP